ncbi:MAG: recombinase XerD [Caldilineae bacterium]|nr:MAG: recombinase XerD [Caldilineae bacterium]
MPANRQWFRNCYAERMKKLPPEMARAIEAHQDFLVVRNYSDYTVFERRYYVMLFCEWAAEREITRPDQVTLQILESYQRYVFHHRTYRGRKLGTSALRSHMVNVGCWLKWLYRHEMIPTNPTDQLQLPRQPHRLPRGTFTREEVERLLAEPDLSKPTGLRDRAMMELMYSTAMRRGEIVTLMLDDLDLTRGTVRILDGKGLKDRVVPMGDRARKWIEAYLEKARPELEVRPGERSLFLTMTGRQILPGALSDTIKKWMRRAGIEKKGACHLFRHTAATEMLRNGANVRHIQAYLGHSDLNATQIYTQVTINDLLEVHRQTHPAENGRRYVGGQTEAGDQAHENAGDGRPADDAYRGTDGAQGADGEHEG